MIPISIDAKVLGSVFVEFLNNWLPEAEAATARAIESWESWYVDLERSDKPPDFPEADKKIWRELRDQLLAHVTHHKCAYCETIIVRDPGDTEHYRPKGAVCFRRLESNRDEIVGVITPDGNEIKHPGYFWLAFDVNNLLPSCKRCNSIHGKRTQFPLRESRYVFLYKPTKGSNLKVDCIESHAWPGWYYLSPSELDDCEEPMLLHPYKDNPSDHLEFLDGGFAVSRRGGDAARADLSIDVFDLNDELLRQQREKAQRLARHAYLARVGILHKDGRTLEDSYARAFRTEGLLSQDAEYSAASRDAVVGCIPEAFRHTCSVV